MSQIEIDDAETVKSVGRSLAWIKKRNPELYRILIEKAKEEGLKASDIILDALKFAYIQKEKIFEGLTAREFLVIVEKWNELQANMLKYMLDLIKVFWVEGFTKYNEIINAITEALKEEEKEREKELKEKKKPNIETVMAMISALPQMITTILQVLPEIVRSSLAAAPTEIKTESTSRQSQT